MENDKHHVFLEFELPEFKRDEIDIKIEEEKITINAKTKKENTVKKKDFESYEKSSQDFHYTSNLPPVKKDEAKIKFYDGNLEITIPKK